MREVMTKSMARNIFYGGSLFFIIIFVLLTIHSHLYARSPQAIDVAGLNEAVGRGKHVWERHACVNCHSILGEGAYFAPEVGNVMVRWGVQDDLEAATESLKTWMDAMPTNIPGRRQMPNFNLTDQEYSDLAEFLVWTSKINTQNWPPNDAG